MFRNVIMLRAQPPFPRFLLLKLTISAQCPVSFTVQSFCWKLSRKLRLACFMQFEDIYIIHHASQSDAANVAVKALTEAFDVHIASVEEAGNCESLVIKAIDCSLRSLFLEAGNWSCLGDSYVIGSAFGVDDVKRHLHALHLSFQSECGDRLVILVSPDAIQFSRHKIADLLCSKMLQKFHKGEQAIVDAHCHATSCTVLPSLCEGHVIGLSKVLPIGEDLEYVEAFCSLKHGLELKNECFMNIQTSQGGFLHTQWFPSALVLHGSGLNPVPQSSRVAIASDALRSFLKIVEGWNFFDAGPLKIERVCRLGGSFDNLGWSMVSSACQNNAGVEVGNVPLSVEDFRTPRPAVQPISSGPSESTKSHSSILYQHSETVASVKAVTKLRPLFMSHLAARKKTYPVSSASKVDNRSFAHFKKDVRNISSPPYDRVILPTDCCIQGSINMIKEGPVDMTGNMDTDKQDEIIQTDNQKAMKAPQQQLGPHHKKAAKWNVAKKVLDTNSEELALVKAVKQEKRPINQSDIVAKVLDFIAKGQCKLLSVPELKCFLSSRKAKVGGRKEELIQRAFTLLNLPV